MSNKKNALPNQKNRLLGIEILRFISAFSILIWHYQHFSFIADTPVNFEKEQQPFYSVLKIFYNHGHLGVNVFWCISGFIFFWKYRETLSNGIVDGKKFLIARFSRLYPLHFVTLIIVMVLQFTNFSINNNFFIYQINDSFHFILQLFMASYWGFDSGLSYNGPIWSISLEILVYIMFFIILTKVSKSILINILILGICAAVKIIQDPAPSHEIINCIAFFYMGGLSAIVCHICNNKKYNFFLSKVAAFILIIMPIVIWLFKMYKINNFTFVFLIFYTPVLLYFASHNIKISKTSKLFIESAGNLTYSSYLIHFPIQLSITIIYSLINKQVPMYNSLFFFSYILLTLTMSYFIYYYFEAPVQKFIRRKLI